LKIVENNKLDWNDETRAGVVSIGYSAINSLDIPKYKPILC
jgi:hypothetical protein